MKVDVLTKSALPIEDTSVLEAQLHTVAYLHLYLPLYPAVWICRKLNSEFLVFYIKERARYTTVKLAMAVFFFATFAPFLYGNTMLNSCTKKLYDMQHSGGSTEHVEMKEEKCEFEDWLRSTGSLLFWLVVNGIVVLLMFYALRFLQQHRRSMFRMMALARNLLPRLIYNGFGPHMTEHSAKEMFKITIAGFSMASQYSTLHDYFGTLDMIAICLALAFQLSLSFVLVGVWESGLHGALQGAAIGVIVARLLLSALNSKYLLGASDKLISMIHAELISFQPHRKLMTSSRLGEINYDIINEHVQQTVKIVYNQKPGIPQQHQGDADKLATQILSHGAQVVAHVAEWLKKHEAELPYQQAVCYELFNADGNTFACSEYTAAMISLLDISMFLLCYFDKDWKVLCFFKNITNSHLHKSGNWSPDNNLEEIFITHPKKRHCKRKDGSCKWECKGSAELCEELTSERTADYRPLAG